MYNVVKIHSDDHLNGKVSRIVDTIRDVAMQSWSRASRVNRKQAQIYSNADDMVDGGADEEYYFNSTAFDILQSNESGTDLVIW